MKKLFPLARTDHQMKTRTKDKFKVNYAKTDRYKKSAIPYMQNLLNSDAKKVRSFMKSS